MKTFAQVFSALVSAGIFSVLLAIYFLIPQTQINESISYPSFSSLFILYFLISLPMILIGGLILSAVTEKINKHIPRNIYLKSLLIFGAGGNVVNYFFIVSIINQGFNRDTLFFMVLGILASWIFLHISMVVRKYLLKMRFI